MSETKMLKLIGYWGAPSSDGFYHPRRFVSKQWDPSLRKRVCEYLRSGFEYASYKGYSHCRFRCGIPNEQMGGEELTDGVWAWPEGLAHYVEAHRIILPSEFVSHAESNQWEITRSDQSIELRRVLDMTFWKQWCSENASPPAWWQRLLGRT